MANLIDLLGLSNFQSDRPMLSDDSSDSWISAGSLLEMAEAWRVQLEGPRNLVFHYIPNTVDGVSQFFGAISAGHVVALLDPNLPVSSKDKLAQLYRPGIIIDGNEFELCGNCHNLHPKLAILLSTSGSTGSPKFVRLSSDSLAKNGFAISDVLGIRPNEVGCGHLPLHYSYGLSVLTSHFSVGAPVHLTQKGFTDAEFWAQMKKWEIAHLPGVPFHYTTLRRFGFAKLDLPKLRVMTQAGGNLDTRIRNLAHEHMDARGGNFFVMYGQTEAAPRMTTLTHIDFPDHSDSVGLALKGGRLEILNNERDVNNVGVEGEVIYHGPNVMMGYAECPEDLELGDVLKGRLATGDIGLLDSSGRLTLTGRAKRMGKIAGLRVNLDDIESVLHSLNEEFAVVQIAEKLILYHLKQDDNELLRKRVLNLLMARFNLPIVAFHFKQIDRFPRTTRDKINYQELIKSQ